jgi:HSP20 family protein
MILSSEEFDRLFSELYAGGRPGGVTSRARADVYVTDDPPTLVVEFELPGLDLDTLQVVLEPGVLQIQGERRRSSAGPRRVYEHAEIDWGAFSRRLSLGRSVDPESSSAEYRDGILALRMPFAQSAPPGRVLVTVRIAG